MAIKEEQHGGNLTPAERENIICNRIRNINDQLFLLARELEARTDGKRAMIAEEAIKNFSRYDLHRLHENLKQALY